MSWFLEAQGCVLRTGGELELSFHSIPERCQVKTQQEAGTCKLEKEALHLDPIQPSSRPMGQ